MKYKAAQHIKKQTFQMRLNIDAIIQWRPEDESPVSIAKMSTCVEISKEYINLIKEIYENKLTKI